MQIATLGQQKEKPAAEEEKAGGEEEFDDELDLDDVRRCTACFHAVLLDSLCCLRSFCRISLCPMAGNAGKPNSCRTKSWKLDYLLSCCRVASSS